METKDYLNEQGRERTDSSKNSKVREIHDLLKRKISLKEKTREVFSIETSLRGIGEMQKIYRELLSLLEDKKYTSFQRKIGMKESEIDGKLGEATLRKLSLYLIEQEKLYPFKKTTVHYLADDLVANDLVANDLEKQSYIKWTETSSESRLLSIKGFLLDGAQEGGNIPSIKRNLLEFLNQQRYKDFQRKIGMPESERDGKLGKKTLDFTLAYFSNLEECKKWTETDPLSKLNEIKIFINDISDEGGTQELYSLKGELIYLINKGDYRGFQRKIGMKGDNIDGKLGQKTLTTLRLFLSPYLRYIVWTEHNKESKLLEIRALLKKQEKTSTEPKKIKQLSRLLETKDYKAFQRTIKIKGEDIDGMLGQKTLITLNEYLMLFEKRIPGRFKLIKKDGNRGEYTYLVKTGGRPKNIKWMFNKQIQRPSSAIKILDENGQPFLDSEGNIDENHVFSAGDKIIVKGPLEDKERTDDTLEKIAIQEKYINEQDEEYQSLLKRFNTEHPMSKDIEFSCGIPVYKYQNIEKTLEAITVKQKEIDPKKFEVVILLNRPNITAEFDSTRDKIIAFKRAHPQFNISIFEHTFNFEPISNEQGQITGYKQKKGEIFKMLGDIITYRNTERKKIRGMNFSKIRNLVIKTGGADSTDKNPRYIINQIEKYAKEYDGRENVRMIGDSRIPADVAINFPLVEISEFLQRKFDDTYANGHINRDVGIGTYKARLYAASGGFAKEKSVKEDMDYVSRMRTYVKEHDDTYMHDDSGFVGAVDNSTDRGIFSMLKGKAYCDRNYNPEEEDEIKSEEWNDWALEHINSSETNYLKLTKANVEKNIGAYYQFVINSIFTGRKPSNKYKEYSENEGKRATIREKFQFIKMNVVDPIMQQVLADPDLTGLDPNDYVLECEYDKEYRKNYARCKIILKDGALEKIKRNHQRKINDDYYDYWK